MKIRLIKKLGIILGTCTLLALLCPASAEEISLEGKAKVEARLKELQTWGSDAKFLAAFKSSLAARPAEAATMTQEKWKDLTLLDPFVRSFTKNQLGEYLKTLKKDDISEAFVSAEDGTKVAFLSKTTYWCHKGKSKHDKPMTGQTWVGPLEMDDSSGTLEVQVSFPLLDGGKPIGSIVVGLDYDKLGK